MVVEGSALGRAGKIEGRKGDLSGERSPFLPPNLPLSPPKTFGYRIPLVRSGEDLLFIFVRRIIGKGAYWSLSVFVYCIEIIYDF